MISITQTIPDLKIRNFSIFLVWLIHVAGIIGIQAGFQDWFITKTPFNLLVMLGLLVINMPVLTKKELHILVLIFTAGMAIEVLGVQTGFPFGTYAYGANLGPKLAGVPLLIGVNWAVLTFITADMASNMVTNKWMKMVTGALLMVIMDYFLEHSAPAFDFWNFEGNTAPLSNYIAWFGVALGMQYMVHYNRVKGDLNFSYHLYVTQLVFFISFYVVKGL